METLIIAYTILTITGITSMVMAFSNKKRPIALSGFHLFATLVGFGVFTFYLVNKVPEGVFTWPRISYTLYGLAGMVTFAAVILNKVFNFKLPKWLPASYGTFEVLGYAALWITVITFYL